ncbi:cytochrome o ubiquinol oxidase operon protein cyoD [Rhizomicrobium palustre]|uniref:Cytochrome bo(3) ubiquinol oxidase subunit 4 n=1 Tax=Rhizomicrobium palustre TaxID=189966 RepID=A0A846MU45_9PROT|nr:cytochrome o ubiquinol oxidase subunit IV [Rhizomicrobium palustre]NIK86755.1 cytochrome o ubiquinol oxidase operon protein cyoD [Rhizomicrobium palustre]
MSSHSAQEDELTGDRGPTDPDMHESLPKRLQGYLLGLALAAGLTVASFWAAQTPLIYGPSIPMALVALAIAQIGVHLVFFLHITTGPDNTNNTMALAFGILIVFLVVVGSIWIMFHLGENLMPHMSHSEMKM